MDILNGIKNFLSLINDNWTTILVIIGLALALWKKFESYSKLSTDKKIEIAKKYIEDGKMRVYEIADSIGWEDTAYFSRVFKKYTGYSPKEYEKLYRR